MTRIVGLPIMAHSTRCPAPADHLPSPQEEHHGQVRKGQGPQEVGGWREAVTVAAFLLFSVFVFGLATLSGK